MTILQFAIGSGQGLLDELMAWQKTASGAATLSEALEILRTHLDKFGIRDLAYGYMVEEQSHVRHDVVMIATIPAEVMRVYYKHGAFDFDPVADQVGDSNQPFCVDLKSLYQGREAAKFRGNVTMRAFLDRGYRFFWSFPFVDMELLGFGALTMHLKPDMDANSCDLQRLNAISNEFHQLVKSCGLLAKSFDLTELEATTLQSTMRGHTASKIAEFESVSTRTVEHRLQSAREKLRAKTTAEAVFKAIAYGIIKDR